MQQQMQPQSAASPQLARLSPLRRGALLLLVVLSSVFALPALLAAWLMQRSSASSWDYKDRWAGVWIFAGLGIVAYILLIWLVHALAFIFAGFFAAFTSGLFVRTLQWLLLLWGLHLLLSPLLALLLEAIAPRTQISRSIKGNFPPAPAPSLSPPFVGLVAPTREAINGHGVLGLALEGGLYELVEERYFTYPLPVLLEHGLIIGMSGTGKSELLNRISYFARRSYGMKVIRIDGKGDWRDMAKFQIAMLVAGASSVQCYPVAQHNGWYGSRQDVLFRLLSGQRFEHSYYQGVCYNMLRMALYAPNVAPVSSGVELVKRLWPSHLMALYKGRPEYQYLQGLPPDAIWGPFGRYNALFSVIGDRLDGVQGFGDADCSYYLLDKKRLQDQIGIFAKLLLDDFELYLSLRSSVAGKPRILLIIDDYSGFSELVSIFDLIERLRSAGVAVLASVQGFNALAATPQQARRLLEGGGSLMLHRCALPKELLEVVATHEVPDLTIRYGNTERDEYGFTNFDNLNVSVRMREESSIHPNEIKGLRRGEMYFIHGVAHQRVAVECLPLFPEEVEDQAIKFQAAYQQQAQAYEATQLSQPVIPPVTSPPRKPHTSQKPKGGGGAPPPAGAKGSTQGKPGPGSASSPHQAASGVSPPGSHVAPGGQQSGQGAKGPQSHTGTSPTTPGTQKARPKITQKLPPGVQPSSLGQGLSLSDLNN